MLRGQIYIAGRLLHGEERILLLQNNIKEKKKKKRVLFLAATKETSYIYRAASVRAYIIILWYSSSLLHTLYNIPSPRPHTLTRVHLIVAEFVYLLCGSHSIASHAYSLISRRPFIKTRDIIIIKI